VCAHVGRAKRIDSANHLTHAGVALAVDVSNADHRALFRQRVGRERGLVVNGVNFGATAMPPQRFKNRRAEIFWRLKVFTVDGGVVRNDALLKQASLAIDAWHDEYGRLQLEAT
jgi:hypothetical protein